MLERRLKWLAGLILIWGGLILCKLVSLQVVHHRQYAGLARARQEQVVKILAPRGTILDRTGAPLAMSVPTQSILVNPQKVPDLGVAADIFSMVLRMDRADLFTRLEAAREDGRGYFVVKKKATWEEAQRLRGMGFDWIQIDSGSERHYPNGPLAAHILGGVDFAEKGNSGIEKVLEAELEGAPGEERVLTDVKGRGIDALVESEPKPGAALTLTIDERLQFVAERELAAAAEAKGAHCGSVVVMNPQDGEILALASYPPYDPNLPPDGAQNPEARLNHASSVPFEPGSVFKVVTLAAALETTQLRPDSMIDCGRGSITLFGATGWSPAPPPGSLTLNTDPGSKGTGTGVIQPRFRVLAPRIQAQVVIFLQPLIHYVLLKESALIPDGRILIDTEQSFVYREGGLDAVLMAARLTGLSPNLASRFTPGTLISSYEVYEAVKRGIAVPFRKRDPEQSRKLSVLQTADRGGMMFQPEPGTFENVEEIDYTSMYPSIIVKSNLSPETVGHQERAGFLPAVLKPLLELRVKTKQLKKTDPRFAGY